MHGGRIARHQTQANPRKDKKCRPRTWHIPDVVMGSWDSHLPGERGRGRQGDDTSESIHLDSCIEEDERRANRIQSQDLRGQDRDVNECE